MTSVNSPACLLARNHFYRSMSTHTDVSPSPEKMNPVFNTVRQNQRQVTLWVTMATPQGFPGGIGTKGLWVNISLGSPSSLHLNTSKPTSPADRSVK